MDVMEAPAAGANVICKSSILKLSQSLKMGSQSLAPERVVVEAARDAEAFGAGIRSRVLCAQISVHIL